MNKYQATIFSTDSDIYTALQSNKIKLSDNSIREIAFNRGVLFASNLERDALIEKYLNSLSHILTLYQFKTDWQQIQTMKYIQYCEFTKDSMLTIYTM